MFFLTSHTLFCKYNRADHSSVPHAFTLRNPRTVLSGKMPRKILHRRIPGRKRDGQIPRNHRIFPTKATDQGILEEHEKKSLENIRELLEEVLESRF